MLIVVLALAIVASVPLTGGDVRRLGALELRHVWAPPAAIVVQTVAIDAVPTIEWLAVGLHIGSYLLLCWWLWANRHVAGLWLVGAGGIANFLAISTNGGVMPARPEALATAGLPVGEGFANSAAATDAVDRATRSLTPRQAEVFGLMVEGLSNAEIADRLLVSIATVKSHVHQVLRALGAVNRVEAIALATRARDDPSGGADHSMG